MSYVQRKRREDRIKKVFEAGLWIFGVTFAAFQLAALTNYLIRAILGIWW